MRSAAARLHSTMHAAASAAAWAAGSASLPAWVAAAQQAGMSWQQQQPAAGIPTAQHRSPQRPGSWAPWGGARYSDRARLRRIAAATPPAQTAAVHSWEAVATEPVAAQRHILAGMAGNAARVQQPLLPPEGEQPVSSAEQQQGEQQEQQQGQQEQRHQEQAAQQQQAEQQQQQEVVREKRRLQQQKQRLRRELLRAQTPLLSQRRGRGRPSHAEARAMSTAAAAAANELWQPPPPLPADFQLPVPNLGYTCLNEGLRLQHGIRTNRRCLRSTWENKARSGVHKSRGESGGLGHVSKLALANCRDLLPILHWNARHGIHFFRIPSELFPWAQEYELEQLPDYEAIVATLAAVGETARACRQRLTAHPSHYVQLASVRAGVVERSLRHLELNARVFDLMGFAPSHDNKVNIHIGGTYGCKQRALARFARSLDRLSPGCRARITVENDDRPAYFSMADLLPLAASTGTPLVFDYLHHALVPGGMGEEEALCAALATWPAGVRPVVHYSESSEDPTRPRLTHSRMLTQPFDLYGHDAEVDVMLEAKGMEKALLFYRDDLQLGRKRHTVAPPEQTEEELEAALVC